MNYCRLTDADRRFGPIDIGARSKTWRPLAVYLESGSDEYPGCYLYMGAFGWPVRLRLPQILKPWRSWVDTSKYEWSKNPAGGYWDIEPRQFGVQLSDGFLQVFLGPQTNDSLTTKSWCCHLPWTQWRFVRQSWYGPTGQHIETLWQSKDRALRSAQSDWRYEFEKTLAKTRFEFDDFDGERIEVATHIEEREWRFGEGWFKWMSLFRRPRVIRSLDLEFSKEVGREKGSWKGGTMGHGIDMLPGELHEAAFKRYCEQHQLKFVGLIK